MKTRTRNLFPLFAVLLLLSACAAGKPALPAPVEAQPSGIYTARTAAAELHIVSPGGSIRIDKLEIDNGETPLVAQADNPAPAQCPFPAAPAAPAPAAGREAGAASAAGAGGDVADRAVEPTERTDAAPAGEYRLEPEKTGRTLKMPKREPKQE
jgi:hypothetical protein